MKGEDVLTGFAFVVARDVESEIGDCLACDHGMFKMDPEQIPALQGDLYQE
jgi:hypothetical protein